MSRETVQRWRKTRRGLVTNLYQALRYRNEVEFDLNWLHDFSDCKKFERLFIEWEKSGYAKRMKPTIDRISNKRGYDENNVHWMPWHENRYKQTMERRRRKGPVAQLLDGKVIQIHKSQREAVKNTGGNQGCISMALNGKRPLAGGYSWRYIHEHPHLLEGK